MDGVVEVQVTGPSAAEQEEMLESLGRVLSGLRKDAVDARKSSGIEQVWTQCEEAYQAIDDSNRNESAGGAKWAKPTTMQGHVTSDRGPKTGERSTAFVRLTSRYVDMAAAKMGEILLPIDDKAFAIQPTPIPELVAQLESAEPVLGPDQQPLMRNPRPEELPADTELTPGNLPPQKPLTVGDLAKAKMDKAQEAAEKAETRIYDWMQEAKYPTEMRKVIRDAARLGVGVLKGPFPVIRKAKSITRGPDGVVAMEMVAKIVPGMRWVDPWNFYPDASCGENICDGDYVWECDYVSEKTVRELKNDETYLPEQLDKVLKEGPEKCYVDDESRNQGEKDKRYRIWYFTGTIKIKELKMTRAVGVSEEAEDDDLVSAVVTMINDSVVKAVPNPLTSGSFGYRAMPWSRRIGYWAGVGVAEQLEMPQRAINAATRRLYDNAGVSSGSQIVMDQKSVVPADGRWNITPDKLWFVTQDATDMDVRKMFAAVTLPNTTEQLMSIINLAAKMAEEATNIPLVTQGQPGPTTPDTFGATELQNNNGHALLRSVAESVDDYITEPLVDDFYEWLLLDEDVPADEKGDFQIVAQGSTALVERAIQEQTLIQMAPMVKDPAFEINPKKWIEQVLKSKRIDPRRLMFSEEEIKEMQANAQPPVIPQLEVAKLNAEVQKNKTVAEIQSKEKIAEMTVGATLQKSQVDTDRDMVYVEAETQRTANEHQARMAELEVRRELAMLDYANKREMTLEQVKAKLADTAMKLQVQKDLSKPPTITPPSEPTQHAPDGQAYQQ